MKIAHVLSRMLMTTGVLGLAACTTPPQGVAKDTAAKAAPVVVYAAGSLRGALTAIAKDYEAGTGQKIALYLWRIGSAA